MGTGTADMVRIAGENNLREPVFEQSDDFKTIVYRPSTDQVPQKYRSTSAEVTREYTVELKNLLKANNGEMSRKEIQKVLELKHEGNFRENYLEPALIKELIEMKFPNSPNHPKQKYLKTKKGIELLTELKASDSWE